jgi:hypothetical protein
VVGGEDHVGYNKLQYGAWRELQTLHIYSLAVDQLVGFPFLPAKVVPVEPMSSVTLLATVFS